MLLVPLPSFSSPRRIFGEKHLCQAINLAGWLRFKASKENNPRLRELAKEAIRNADSDVRKRAKSLMKNYPNLIPKVKMELVWPEETKKKWRIVMGDEPRHRSS